MNTKLVILGFVFIILAIGVRAESFSISPKTLTYSYSEEEFLLPKVEVSAGASSVELHPKFECLPEFECISDFCRIPSSLFLLSEETKQFSIECSLPDLNRSFGGRVVFSDSEFVDIFVFPADSISSFIPMGSFSSEEPVAELVLFWLLVFVAFVLFVITLLTKKAIVILLFGLDILLLFLFF